jgi:hypothetical protein
MRCFTTHPHAPIDDPRDSSSPQRHPFSHPPQEMDTTALSTYLVPWTGVALTKRFLLGLFSLLRPADCSDIGLLRQPVRCIGNFSSRSPSDMLCSSIHGDLTVRCGDACFSQCSVRCPTQTSVLLRDRSREEARSPFRSSRRSPDKFG